MTKVELERELEQYSTNNFYLWFPGGMYREPDCGRPKAEQVISDLDGLIEESGFDVNAFEAEREAYLSKSREIEKIYDERSKQLSDRGLDRRLLEILLKDDEELKVVLEQVQVYLINVFKRVYPYYERMLKQGYTREELTT